MGIPVERGRLSRYGEYWLVYDLPPCPTELDGAAYRRFVRHVREGVSMAAIAREHGTTPYRIGEEFDRTHSRLRYERVLAGKGVGQ